jgi:AraC-like DNA-binding protein
LVTIPTPGVGFFAKSLGLSESKLKKAIRENLQMSPAQFIRLLRFQEAAVLLRDHQLSVKKVAEDMGYANQFGFSRAFKKVIGVSPSDYRAAGAGYVHHGGRRRPTKFSRE